MDELSIYGPEQLASLPTVATTRGRVQGCIWLHGVRASAFERPRHYARLTLSPT